MTAAAPPVPLHERPEIHSRRWFLLGLMCLSLVLVVMSVSGLNVALPSMQRSLDAGATDLQWIVDSYAIVFAGLLLSAGAVGDRFGRKLALLGGLAVFAVGSVIGALADTTSLVIVSRAVSGIGAAFIMPATLSLLTTVFPPEERSKAIAIWAGFAGAGGAIGPLVVGFLLTGWWFSPAFWWGSAFVVNAVVASVVLVIIAIYAPRTKDEGASPLDPLGAILSMLGIGSLLYGIIEGPERGWTDGLVLGAFVAAVLLVAALVAWEFRTRYPMLPMEFFRDRRFTTGAAVITFGFMVMFGFFFLITQYFQFVRGYSPLKAGVATLPFAATMILVAPRSAGLAQRHGVNRVVGGGFVSLAAGFALLAFFAPDTPYLLVVVALVLLAAGMGLTSAPATGSIMSSIPMTKAGVGSAVNDTTRELGGAIGIAVLGSIVASAYRANVDTSGLSGPAAEAAGESIGAALGVAGEIGGPEGQALVDHAGQAFTDAINVAFGASAVIAIVAAGLLFISRASTSPAFPDDVDEAVSTSA